MGDLESDRRRLRVSAVEERETKRVRINVLEGEESGERVEAEDNEGCSLLTTPRADLT